MTETIKAWHFVGDRLRDDRPVPPDGMWLRHDGAVEICASGLHASRQPWDALRYAPGATLCYVECRGDIHEHYDKLVCRERRILVRADLTETFRFFARMQALSVIHLWPQSPPDVLLDYLMTGDESLRCASWDAASAAACAAGSAAGSAASWVAAKTATAASLDAARAAARAAASAAANAAAGASWDAGSATTSATTRAAASAAAAASLDASAADFDALIFEQFGVAT